MYLVHQPLRAKKICHHHQRLNEHCQPSPLHFLGPKATIHTSYQAHPLLPLEPTAMTHTSKEINSLFQDLLQQDYMSKTPRPGPLRKIAHSSLQHSSSLPGSRLMLHTSSSIHKGKLVTALRPSRHLSVPLVHAKFERTQLVCTKLERNE